MDGYRPQSVSRKGDICLHWKSEAALKWTTETPVNMTFRQLRNDVV